MLVIVPFIGAVVTEDNLATGGKVEVTVVAGDTTGEVHASLWVLLLPPPLILLKSSKSGKSKAGKEASSSYCSERHLEVFRARRKEACDLGVVVGGEVEGVARQLVVC